MRSAVCASIGHRGADPRRSAALVALLAALAAPGLIAERLPAKQFTRADGLSHESVTSLLEDSRGFLWMGTIAGVSRFDGSLFRTYEIRDGLIVHPVNMLLETRDHALWIATNGGGVARLAPDAMRSPSGDAPLERYRLGDERRSNRVNDLVEAPNGALWAGTDGGLFRRPADGGEFEHVRVGLDGIDEQTLFVPSVRVAADGRVWLGTEIGLVARSREGHAVQRWSVPHASAPAVIRMAIDRTGLIWGATRDDLRVLRPPPPGARIQGELSSVPCAVAPDGRVRLPQLAGESCTLTRAHGLPEGFIQSLTVEDDDRVVLGTVRGGIVEIADGRVRTVAAAHDRYSISSIVFDRGGNRWVATDVGVFRFLRRGLVSFDAADGLRGIVRRFVGGHRQSLFIMTHDDAIHELGDEGFVSGRPQYPPGVGLPSWGSAHVADGNGGWWVPTSGGLCHYRAEESVLALAAARAPRCFTTRDGLPGNDIAFVMIDSRGGLWVGLRATTGPVIARRAADGEPFTAIEVDGLSPISTPVDFVEDPDGMVWVGFRDGGVARCRHTRCALVLPTAVTYDLLVDASGRLWVSTRTGLVRVDDRSSETVTAARVYTSRDGLSADATYALVDDAAGRVYVGTDAGVDRLDPVSGAARHLSQADGLLPGAVIAAHRDDVGHLWFGTRHGISRYEPEDERGRPRGTPRIAYVRVGDEEWPISEFGQQHVTGVALPSEDASLEIGFSSMDVGRTTRFEYRLGPLEPWVSAGQASSVVYPRLAPGAYVFEVRALSGSDVTGTASVAFRVPPPWWLQWPFLALTALAIGAVALSLHRIRVGRLVSLERIRTRIATDLHDDIGSTLTRIAILAEGARRRTSESDTVGAPLANIAASSRDLLTRMSDIVWAVNPRYDSLRDLVHRMRHFAEATLEECDIALQFTAPPEDVELALEADLRREIYLVLKEAVANIAKHSRATEATIELWLDGHHLRLEIADNGIGFEPNAPTDGNGLANLRRRSDAVGGVLVMSSAPGAGTRLRLDIDLRRARARAV